MKIVLFGPPGAGKGTQAQKIKKVFQIPHLSTGDIFRDAIRNRTELGKRVKSILDSGELVPDQTVVDLVSEELEKEIYSNGYILDGFPRTVAQAESFQNILNKKGESLSAVVSLEVPETELIRRILSRDEGRSDDTEEKVQKRLQVYRNETEPVKAFYKNLGLVKEIKGTGTVQDIFERITSAIQP
ncbi:MAG: adenylate kinase [Balneolaceae bacterium]